VTQFANRMDASPEQCAAEIVETVPLLMRIIRSKVRSQTTPELSIPQLRALAFLGRNKEAMVTDVAAFLGLTLPSTSKLVDGLVVAGMTTREPHPTDRRKVSLTLTRSGRRKYEVAVKYAQDFLAERVARLSKTERGYLHDSMKVLHALFSDTSLGERPQ
jgi:DNA-binding MarR family transcriptional regulator